MIKIFKVGDCFAYTTSGYTVVHKGKNPRKFAEIIFGEVEEAKNGYGRKEKIAFPKRTLIEHEYSKKPRIFLPFTKREIKKFWNYYKKLAE